MTASSFELSSGTVGSCTTTNATPTEILRYDFGGHCCTVLAIEVAAIDDAHADAKSWRKQVTLFATSGDASIVSSVVDLVTPPGTVGANLGLWDVDVSVDGTVVVVKGKGASGKTVDWAGRLSGVTVIHS